MDRLTPGSRGWLALRLWNAPALLLTLAVLFWSGNFVVGRAVHAAVPPVALAFWRWTGSLVLLIGFAWPHLRRDLPVLRRHGGVLLLLSFFGVAVFNTLIYLALNSTTAVNALLMQSVMPLVILLCSYLLFGERARRVQLFALAVSLAGVAVIVGRGSAEVLLGLSFTAGDAWVLVAVVCYALYSALLRRRPPVHPLSFLAATFALGAAMLLPLYAWEHLAVEALRPGGVALAAIAYVAVFPSLLAYLCFNRGVELLGANQASPFLHLMPVFGSLMAVVFLGERLQGFHAAGAALIAAGIGLAAMRKRPPEAAAPAPEGAAP